MTAGVGPRSRPGGGRARSPLVLGQPRALGAAALLISSQPRTLP
jgi:hypothetical protein